MGITILAADEVVDTEVIDFTFLFYLSTQQFPALWGVLKKVDGAGHVNMFNGVQRGDWSSPEFCWQLVLGSGQEATYNATADATSEGMQAMLRDLLRALGTDGTAGILVEASLMPEIRAALSAIGAPDTVHHYAGTLATSANPYPGN